MRQKILLGILFAAATTAFFSAAASVRSSKLKAGAEAEVAAREDQYTNGAWHKNIRVLREVFASTFVDTNAAGVVRDKQQMLRVIAAAPPIASIKVDQRRIQVYGDAAVVTGRFTVTAKSSGKTETESGRFTDVWAKMDGKWQCVAAHSSTIPTK